MPEGNELLDKPVGIAGTQSNATQILLKALEKKMTRQERYWVTSKMHEVMAHETNLELIRAYQNDPDLFWKLALLGGGALSVLGAALAGTQGSSVDTSKDVLPGGLVLGEMMMIPAGLTLAGFSAFMLAFPRVFGADGIQMKVSGGGWGFSGEAEVG